MKTNLDQTINYGTSSSKTNSFYQSIVMNILESMSFGCLTIELPNSTKKIIGDPDSQISADIKINRPEFFKKCVLFGEVGFGEAYVDGDWDTQDISKVIFWAIANISYAPVSSLVKSKFSWVNIFGIYNKLKHLLRSNSMKISRRNIHEHYDLGNALYKLFLDETMTYSSAYFEYPDQSLKDAQIAKYEHLCRKLKLKNTDNVLEIGSGWGGFSCYAAEKYGCNITTITISEEQHKYVQELIKQRNLSNQIEVNLQDYRLVKGSFDKIVSIEMLEAVGEAYFETYFKKCNEVLKKDGLLGIQVIVCPDSRYESVKTNIDWTQKHIFPGGLLPSVGRINQAINTTSDLFLYNLEDLGRFYVKTLNTWRKTFNQKLDEVKSLGFDQHFIRKWNYYLSYCEAAFLIRNITVMQVVYARPNNLNLSS